MRGWDASHAAPRAAEVAAEAPNAASVRKGERNSVSPARCSLSSLRSCSLK